MNYCIKYATKTPLTLSLDMNGNTYSVSVWNEEAHAIEWRLDCLTYEEAEKLFLEIVKEKGYSEPVETSLTTSDFANID